MSENQPYILAKDGNPFTSQQLANMELKRREYDPKQYAVVKRQGGWAICDIQALTASVDGANRTQPQANAETYWWIEPSQRGSPNELQYVPINCNGWQLRLARGKESCVPQSFLNILDHAVQKQFEVSDDPKVPIKEVGTFRRYPYRKIREGTEEDFRRCLAEGNALTNEFIQRMKQTASG